MDLGNFANIVIYVVGALMLGSVLIFVKTALISHRPQKFGLLLAIVAIPLYMIYYDDPNLKPRRFGSSLDLHQTISWMSRLPLAKHADPATGQLGTPDFPPSILPAIMVGVVLLVHMTVLQRVAVRKRLQKVANPIANFFAGTSAAIMVGSIVVTAYHWGVIGALIVTVVSILVYLGALAVLGAIIEITVEVARLLLVWVKRKAFAIATLITRLSSWVSSLSGRLVSRALIERIRAETENQEGIFLDEQDLQDRRLYEAYLRDRARKRRLAKGMPVTDIDDTDPFGTRLGVPSPAAPAMPTTMAAPMGDTTEAPSLG
jgi:hypothetical protein